jgi:2-methylcitrate dehydratase
MLSTAALAGFVADVEYERLPDEIREAAKRRLLDAVGVALSSRDADGAETVRRAMVADGVETDSAVRLWGAADAVPAPRAAMVNAAAIAAGNGPTFPSPTLAPVGGSIAAVLAAAEAHNATGEETLAGVAAALELHGELAWNGPLDGFHPATHTAVAAAAGAGRAMGFGEAALEAAVGAAASRLTLGVEGPTVSPVAAGAAARSAIDACLLAAGGLDGPDSIAAPNGWHDRFGAFDLDLDPGCERVRDAAILPYDGHPYEQAAVEAAVALATTVPLDPAEIDTVTVETTPNASEEIDAGRIAAAIVDRGLPVYRDGRTDVEPIADATTVVAGTTDVDRSGIELAPARLVVESHDGSTHETVVETFEGHPSMPASWGAVEEKFRRLAGDGAGYDADRLDVIVETVRGFEAESATELTRLLE